MAQMKIGLDQFAEAFIAREASDKPNHRRPRWNSKVVPQAFGLTKTFRGGSESIQVHAVATTRCQNHCTQWIDYSESHSSLPQTFAHTYDKVCASAGNEF